MSNAINISLKFNPGHFSHLIATYKLFEEMGYKSFLYVDQKFNSMDENNSFDKINESAELKKLKKIDVAVFWFPSLKNIKEMIKLRFFYGAKIFYVYHEPFDSIKQYHVAGFGFKKILKICLINVVHVPILLLSHKVILPSLTSYNTYKEKYTWLNNEFCHIPLLFDDEASLGSKVEKKFISYIGTVAADHAFDKFVHFVVESLKKSWFKDVKFLIATSSTIPSMQMEELAPYLNSGQLEIYSGKPMKNSEINKHYGESLVVWNAYHRSMQSGVLPKAFMFGASAIVLRRNANEYLKHQETGVLINDNGNLIEIKNAVEEIKSNHDFYFENCRKMFLEKFFYRNKQDDFLKLLKDK